MSTYAQTRSEALTLRLVYRYWLDVRQGHAGANPLDELKRRELVRIVRLAGRAGYDSYLRSAHWREFRLRMLDEADYACEDCGASEFEGLLLMLDVHHLHYETLACERPEDVAVLCRPCHDRCHE